MKYDCLTRKSKYIISLKTLTVKLLTSLVVSTNLSVFHHLLLSLFWEVEYLLSSLKICPHTSKCVVWRAHQQRAIKKLNREAICTMILEGISIKATFHSMLFRPILYTITMAYMYIDFEKSATRITNQFLWPGGCSLSIEKHTYILILHPHRICTLLKNCGNNNFLWLNDQATTVNSRIYLPKMRKCTGKMHI